MKILTVYNHYLISGGEGICTDQEEQLLRDHGHEVISYREHNKSIRDLGPLRTAVRTLWSQHSYNKISQLISEHNPDVLHVQNFFPLISPSVYYAAYKANIPVIQTLQNYRLLCPNACLMRDGIVCEDCLKKTIPWPGIMHACYRENRLASFVVAAMILLHRIMGTWQNKVSAYIVCTNFARKKFIQGGLPAEKLFVKPNFINERSIPSQRSTADSYAIFVGRLSREKGIDMLVDEWKKAGVGIKLKIVGEGPLYDKLAGDITDQSNIELVGKKSNDETVSMIRESIFLLFPSKWYEGMPRTLLEAFACNTPVLSADLGAMQEMIEDHKTGLLFNPNNPQDLRSKIIWAVEHHDEMVQMGKAAYNVYKEFYTPDNNYRMLMNIYSQACAGKNI